MCQQQVKQKNESTNTTLLPETFCRRNFIVYIAGLNPIERYTT